MRVFLHEAECKCTIQHWGLKDIFSPCWGNLTMLQIEYNPLHRLPLMKPIIVNHAGGH